MTELPLSLIKKIKLQGIRISKLFHEGLFHAIKNRCKCFPRWRTCSLSSPSLLLPWLFCYCFRLELGKRRLYGGDNACLDSCDPDCCPVAPGTFRINEVSTIGNAMLTLIKLVVTGDDSGLFKVRHHAERLACSIGGLYTFLLMISSQNAMQPGQPYRLGEVIIAKTFHYFGTLFVYFLLRLFISVFVIIAYTGLKAYTKHMPSVSTVSDYFS